MANRTTGVTQQTSQRIVIDSAVLYLDYGETNERQLGATEGGVTFTIEQEIREPEIDGLPGALMGTRRITSVHPRITAQLMEHTTENLKLALAGSTSSPIVEGEGTEDTHDSITRANFILTADAHWVNIAAVGRVAGTTTPIIVLIKNPIADGEVSLEFSDENEVKPEIQFTGHFDPAAVDDEPWEIRNPIISGT